MDGSGQLDFREFMIGVWNWNTYDATGITKRWSFCHRWTWTKKVV